MGGSLFCTPCFSIRPSASAECLGSQWQRDAALGAAIKKSVWQNVGQTQRDAALGAAIKKSVWQNVGQTPRYNA